MPRSLVFLLLLLGSIFGSALPVLAQGGPIQNRHPLNAMEVLCAQQNGAGLCHCCGPNCPCQAKCTPPCPAQKDLDTIEHDLACAKFLRDLYQQYLTNNPFRTFATLQTAVAATANSSPSCGGGGAGGANGGSSGSGPNIDNGSFSFEYIPKGCKLKSCSLGNVEVKCASSTISVLNDVCNAHEQGHVSDLTSAFQNVKNGSWSEERWNDYVHGTGNQPGDINRAIENELEQYKMEVEALQKWLDAQKACKSR
jgi:hypothetical protein